MNKIFASLAVIAATLGVTLMVHGEGSEPGPEGQVTIVKDKNNVVASELHGTWVLEKDLSTRLYGEQDSFDLTKLTFTQDSEAEKRISDFLNDALQGRKDREGYDEYAEALRRVYLSGEVSITHSSGEFVGDFFLVSLYGNPHVLFYDRQGDMESFNVAIARDEEGDKDLLFVGGDFNNQSFIAFERKGQQASKDEAKEERSEK